MTLGDRIAIFNQGRIEQVGEPMEVYRRPANRFVAGFLGSPAMNLMPCVLEEAAGALRVRLNGEVAFSVPANRTARYRPYVGRSELLFGLRPEHILERRSQLEPNQEMFEVTLEVTEPMGMDTLVHSG